MDEEKLPEAAYRELLAETRDAVRTAKEHMKFRPATPPMFYLPQAVNKWWLSF